MVTNTEHGGPRCPPSHLRCPPSDGLCASLFPTVIGVSGRAFIQRAHGLSVHCLQRLEVTLLKSAHFSGQEVGGTTVGNGYPGGGSYAPNPGGAARAVVAGMEAAEMAWPWFR